MVFGAQLSKEVGVFLSGTLPIFLICTKTWKKLLSSSWKWLVQPNFKIVMFGNFQIMQQRERSEPYGPRAAFVSYPRKHRDSCGAYIVTSTEKEGIGVM